MQTKNIGNKKQELFREIVLGTLLYTVVLGFFNDYTDVIHTNSYSTTFMVAIVMEILTYLTFMLKNQVVSWFKEKQTKFKKLLMSFFIWLILFVSKFIFIEVIAFVFRDEVKISGFIGILVMVACLTIAQRLVDYIYLILGDS